MYIKTYKGFDRQYNLSKNEAVEILKNILDTIKKAPQQTDYLVRGDILEYIEDTIKYEKFYDEIRLILDDERELSVGFCAWGYDTGYTSFVNPKSGKTIHNFGKSIYIGRFGSFQSGAGVEMLKDMLQLAEIEGLPLWLQSSDSAIGFYKRAGMIELNNQCFVNFPKKFKLKYKRIFDAGDWAWGASYIRPIG